MTEEVVQLTPEQFAKNLAEWATGKETATVTVEDGNILFKSGNDSYWVPVEVVNEVASQ